MITWHDLYIWKSKDLSIVDVQVLNKGDKNYGAPSKRCPRPKAADTSATRGAHRLQSLQSWHHDFHRNCLSFHWQSAASAWSLALRFAGLPEARAAWSTHRGSRARRLCLCGNLRRSGLSFLSFFRLKLQLAQKMSKTSMLSITHPWIQPAALQTSAPSNLGWASFCHCQDDFALVLMEDAEGEVLSLTEEYPLNDHFQAWICADSSFTSCKPFEFGQLRGTKFTDRCLAHQIAGFLNIFRSFSSLLWFTWIFFRKSRECHARSTSLWLQKNT